MPLEDFAMGDEELGTTLRELRDAVIANKELIERSWNDHFA